MCKLEENRFTNIKKKFMFHFSNKRILKTKEKRKQL